jgi:hypothetical protein
MRNMEKHNFLKEKLEEGYTQVAMGSGEVYVPVSGKLYDALGVESERLKALWVFYHPEGKVAVYGKFKNVDFTEHTVEAGLRLDKVLDDETELSAFLEQYHVELSNKRDLRTLVNESV